MAILTFFFSVLRLLQFIVLNNGNVLKDTSKFQTNIKMKYKAVTILI
jgi:hypothetical protein